MRKIVEIINILKQKFFLKSDTQLSVLLDMKSQALNNHKLRDTIPFDQLTLFCERENLSFDWLVLGRQDPAETEKKLLEVEKEYKQMKEHMRIFELIISKIPQGEYK